MGREEETSGGGPAGGRQQTHTWLTLLGGDVSRSCTALFVCVSRSKVLKVQKCNTGCLLLQVWMRSVPK